MAVYPERRKGRLTGKWIAETPLHGKRQRARFDTKKEADQWEGIIKLTGELPAVTAPIENLGPTFGEVAREMLAAKSTGNDPSGYKRVGYVMDLIGEDTPIRQVSTRDLDKLVADLKKRPGQKGKTLTPATINRYLSAVSSVLTHAKKRKVIEGVPEIPWQDDDGGRLYFASPEQEAAMVKWLEDNNEPYCALCVTALIETGMRWGELEGLEADQIEPETGWLRLWDTKNGTARSVPITRKTALALKQMVQHRMVPKYSTLRDRLQRAAKSAGLPEGFGIHALRHTTATRLVQQQVNLRIVQKYLGHKSIQTTLKYAHVADEDLQKALKKISPSAG